MSNFQDADNALDDYDLEDVEIVMDDQDADAISKPLVEPTLLTSAATASAQPLLLAGPSTGAGSAELPEPRSFTEALVRMQSRRMELIFCGFTLHGKSTLAKTLLEKNPTVRQDDVRGLTVRSRLTSATVDGGVKNKASRFVSIVEAPGHPALFEEARASFCGCTVETPAVLVVDALEGVNRDVEHLIRLAVAPSSSHPTSSRRGLILFINKLDRLITHQRLTAQDAENHLVAIVDAVNNVLLSVQAPSVSPAKGTVIFASCLFSFAFSIPSIARRYSEVQFGGFVEAERLALKLWGPVHYDASSRKFVSSQSSGDSAFIQFVWEPLCKIFASTVALGGDTIKSYDQLPVSRNRNGTKRTNHKTVQELVSDAIQHGLTGPFHATLVDCLCDAAAVRAVKQEKPSTDSTSTTTIVRVIMHECVTATTEPRAVLQVLKGELRQGQSLFSSIDFDEDEDEAEPVTVGKLFVPEGEEYTEVDGATTSAIVLASNANLRNGDVLASRFDELPGPYQRRKHLFPALAKVSMEPQKPEHVKEMKEALRRTTLLYQGSGLVVEENGEHVLCGTGEVHLDAMLFDIRNTFARSAPLKLSDPYVSFRETVTAEGILRHWKTPNGAPDRDHAIAYYAAPMSTQLTADLDRHELSLLGTPRPEVERKLREKYQWDIVEAQGLLAFGPDPEFGASALCVEVPDAEVSNTIMSRTDIKRSIESGFNLTTRIGPLCGEPVRGVKFALAHFDDKQPELRTMLTRQLTDAAFLSAAPRLLEPIIGIDVLAPSKHEETVRKLCEKRRAAVTSTRLVPSTTLVHFEGQMPLIDSFGFETELRLETNGDASVTSKFQHWAQVPGDPLDTTVSLMPLQAAAGFQLARDFVNKTRRRKGLPEGMGLI